MIRLPSQRQLNVLIKAKRDYCVSIYAPFVNAGSSDKSNYIELKNMIRDAKAVLRKSGAKPELIDNMLQKVQNFVDTPKFWPVKGESVAFFLGKDIFKTYYLPKKYAPIKLEIGTGFYLEPLIRSIKNNKSYHVLTLSHKLLHIYKGDNFSLRQVNIKNFPHNMKKALNIDEYPNWRETHTIAPASNGKGSEAYHGQYNVKETDKDMLLQYFRLVDQRLHPYLKRTGTPLILAGVQYLMPIYRKANTYPHLLPGGISGNFDRPEISLDQIRKHTLKVIKNTRDPK